MAAVSLHHAIFTQEKASDHPLRSASTFLHFVPERDGSPTSQLFMSAAYQDLIQRQPIHPDGPRSGWDLGLNLLGDPITAAEHKTFRDHRTKTKLRRLRVINIVFELLFGSWGTYSTIRYFLASADGLGDTERVCALVLAVLSALSVVLVILSIFMPLFPHQGGSYVWLHTRLLLRASYLLLLSAGSVVNFILVLIWHPSQLCSWDIDVSWHTANVNTTTSPCHAAPFVAWITAATLRVVVTMVLALSFIFTLRSYYATRHPNWISPKYSPYFLSDPEDISPVSSSSPPHRSKSTFRLTRSEDQSVVTLPKYNSISTLAPSTSCTGYSRSHSTPPPKDSTPPRISPPTSRRPSTHPTNHGPETASQTQSISAVTPPSSGPHILRRTSRISVTEVTSDTVLPDGSPHSDGPRDPPEIRSYASWKPVHRGASAHLDVRRMGLAWENVHVHHASQVSVGLESSSSTHDEGESIEEKDGDNHAPVYSYGYGASGPTYPYLDTYNPQRPEVYAESPSSYEDVEIYRGVIPSGPALPEAPSESRSSLSREDEEDEESSGEEEEYVAMMGGFVRRMATIESLGSKEAAGTVSTTGSVALHSVRSKSPGSQFSSVRFAEYTSSGGSSMGVPLSKDGSYSTAYLSFSSGGTGIRVNERGELLPGPDANRSTAGSPYGRQYYTASGSSFPRTNDEHR